MIINDIFTKRQTIISYTVKELQQMYTEEKLKIRDVNQTQVRAIKKYIFDNIQQEQIYFPPLVATTKDALLKDGRPIELSIIDGTQRIKALMQIDELITKSINSDIDEEAKKGFKLMYSLNDTEFAIQIFEGLTDKEANQLYIDLNTKGKKVALSKRIAFDSRNDINQITNFILQHHPQLQKAGVETEKRAIIRPKNKKLLSLAQLRQLIGIFLTGKLLYKSVNLSINLPLDMDVYLDIINSWFDELFILYPAHSIGNYEESMLANFPLLLSLVFYSNKGLENQSPENRKKIMIDRMRNLQSINWNRTNKEWEQFRGSKMGKDNYFYLAKDKENIEDIVKWLERQGR